jgi:cyclophilin family peptidyl-prolyl cis-trans isomerase
LKPLLRSFALLLSAIFIVVSASAKDESKKKDSSKMETNPTVVMKTNHGTIEVELFAKQAPETVKNFLQYVDDGFYNGTIFHRVISDFMVQGGGFTEGMDQKKVRGPIKNEASAELGNTRGTLAMARTSVVDSATAQFFINVKDNAFLNHRDKTPNGFGYAVFGKVTSGMDVVDKIKEVPTTSKAGHENVPVKPVVIESVKRK